MDEFHPLWMKNGCLWKEFIHDYVNNDVGQFGVYDVTFF
jgi:hypothetical protein